ncbi:hypothetical protein FisN_21Lh256 [Fistulifera solaris]|uniref:L domain-like protein n=1 Tax=Fistulifera solaris TaxID=1519565 RepID=A0A1Z5KEW6_FISSO|nr:hypothetical protein FisN_21Lh256 [Fistulifera solaris]|eukprot:GAX24642.1 hypothetical protein FisN_21Lh256 [Fistulifera solaris]
MEMERGNTAVLTEVESGSLPLVEDQHDTASQLLKGKHKQRRWIMAITGVISLFVIAIAAALPLLGNNKAEYSRTKLERLQDLQTILLNVSEPLAFVRLDSPSSQALQYLAYKEDQFHVRTKDRVLQLYALLVVLFTCGGYADLLDDTTVSECEIGYLTCDEKGNLIAVDLSDQKLSGSLPKELGLLTHLTVLDLRNNDLNGALTSDSFATLTNLEQLFLSSNKFTSSISPAMSALTNLRTLDLSNNLLTGSLPSGLAKLSNINEFLVAKNRFVGDIFRIALHWRNMTHLDVEDTDLGGAIPTEIGILTNLTYFETRFSEVRGSIPTEIAKLSKLRQLLIDGPHFEGTLPGEIGQMTELDSISFSGGNFWGTIPTTIGLLTNLQYVRIGDSQVTGTIPTELGNCPKLHKLSFEISQLSGTLPSEFAFLGFLETIFLEFTEITTIPEEVCETGVEIITDCELRCVCCKSGGRC